MNFLCSSTDGGKQMTQDWLMRVDTDTFLVAPNLVQMLKKYDPHDNLFIGWLWGPPYSNDWVGWTHPAPQGDAVQ